MKKQILALILFLITGCASCSPAPKEDGPVIKDEKALCEPACTNARSLGCLWGDDLVYPVECVADANTCEYGSCIAGYCTETCEVICVDNVSKGKYENLQCRINTDNCEDMDVCGQL